MGLMLFKELETNVPIHTQEALGHYLLKGFAPGSFLTAVLENDLYRAVNTADHVNYQQIAAIAKWVYVTAPRGSFGNAETVQQWLDDVDNRRSNFAEKVEKNHMWERLAQ